MKSILDKDFKYTPAAKTDIRRTFARERRRLEELKKGPVNVVVLKRNKK